MLPPVTNSVSSTSGDLAFYGYETDPYAAAAEPEKESHNKGIAKRIAAAILAGTSIEDIAKDPEFSGYALTHVSAMTTFQDLVLPPTELVNPRLKFSVGDRPHESNDSICDWLNVNVRSELKRPIKTPQLWVSGPPSLGKSTLVDLLCEHLNVYVHPYEDWYDAYDGSIELIVLDDFHGEIKLSMLNRLVDGSRVMLKRRGRRPLLKTLNIPVLVLSNRSIRDTYCNVDTIGVSAVESRFLELNLNPTEGYISSIIIDKIPEESYSLLTSHVLPNHPILETFTICLPDHLTL